MTVRWTGTQPPTVGQLWLITYAVFTVRPSEEAFRLTTSGSGADRIAHQLKTVGLAIDHPSSASASSKDATPEQLILRGSFWQGAGSPFGSRPAWAPEDQDPNLSNYPLPPPEYVVTTSNHPSTALSWHPRRRAKPRPGSVIYSRYIPHLGETFSMVALDPADAAHVELFHAWQNDPRVSQGWNQTGTLEQHREYLRQAHADPHKLTILARFDETFFAYFEVYWAKVRLSPPSPPSIPPFPFSSLPPCPCARLTTPQEDAIGGYYSAGDYDRGRHSLVGDVRYRGPHRVSAWWSSLMHYLFLDEPRTMSVVGEPKNTNSSVLMYDLIHGFGLDKFIDLPEKRSAFMRCSRERFFQLCPLDDNEKVMGGTGVGLVPKL